jgi:hypothetical protein
MTFGRAAVFESARRRHESPVPGLQSPASMLSAAVLLFTLAQSPQPLAAYEQQFLSVEDALTVTDGSSSRDVVFTQGKYRQPLSTEDFLRAVGKAEAADTYRHRQTGAAFLAVGGLMTVLIGAASVIAEGTSAQNSCRPADPGFSRCVQDMAHHGGVDTVAVSGLIAAVLFGGAMVVHPSPPDPVEMRRLADEHNQALRVRLSVKGRF